MITQTESKFHNRINLELGHQVDKLYDKGLLTSNAWLLFNKISRFPSQPLDLPISYTKQELKEYFNISTSNFYRDYSCLSKQGIWKVINNKYVIHPQLLFAGKQDWQVTAFNYWQEGRLLTKVDIHNARRANKHK